MESFYQNGKQIIGFCVLVLIFNMVFDQKTTEKFVLLVLFSMCILNADKFGEWFNRTFGGNNQEEERTETAESFTEEKWQRQNSNGFNKNQNNRVIA